ncbi:MAG: T9SS type A sorting domain-containing protein, partial [Syntrophothermus sp.]
AVSKSNPSMMYSAHMSLTTYGIETISYSTNKGDSWTNANIPTGVYSGADNYAGGQGWYDNILRVDPDNENILYAGGVDLWKSTNKGLNWVQVSNWYVDPNAPQYVHADFHAIEFAPSNSNIMYIGNDGGIYRSDNKGISILHKNNNLAITQFYYGAVSATGTNYYGGTQDNGTIESNGGNPLWHDIIGGDGGATEVDYTNDNIIYGEYVNLAFFKSVDGGNSFNKSMSGIPTGPNYWDGTTDRTLFISPFVLDPNDANILVAGTYKLYKTTNKAGNWTSISGDLTGDGTGTNGAKISAIAIAKDNSNIIYAGCTNGKIRVTQDNGTSWGLSSSSLPNAYCTRIAIDPTNPSVAYATYSGFVNGTKVFKTVDYGVNWTNISNNLPNIPVSCIIVNPTNTANLIIGTDLGIFSSENSGASWTRDNNGLPNVAVLDLDYRASDNKIFASTHGRSMFVANLGGGSNISEISYDDGTPTNSYYWNQWGQISANRITPPTLNSKLMKISIYIVSVSEGSATYKPVVLNMRNGLPGIQVANISSRTAQSIPGWDMTDVSAMDINLTGDFLVGMMYDGINKPTYGADPIDNNRAWDYNGTAWSPWIETYFMRATVQTVTAIVDIDTKVPKDFMISQNYPNPFNPTTTINYSLPLNEKVEVIVYDITGRKVAELVNNYQNAGTYAVTWNGKNDAGKNVSSGMYLYSIKAGKFNQVKKMILLK